MQEFHSSALRDPRLLSDRDVLVAGGGASAFDLLELCFQHGARRVIWAYRGTRWFMPTRTFLTPTTVMSIERTRFKARPPRIPA